MLRKVELKDSCNSLNSLLLITRNRSKNKLRNGGCAEELVPLLLIAVEDVEVDLGREAGDTAVAAELPDVVMQVGTELAITSYPETVAVFYVWCKGQVVVGKVLVEVENGLGVRPFLYDAQPSADVVEEHFRAAHLVYLLVGGLNVEHWRQVATTESGIPQIV